MLDTPSNLPAGFVLDQPAQPRQIPVMTGKGPAGMRPATEEEYQQYQADLETGGQQLLTGAGLAALGATGAVPGVVGAIASNPLTVGGVTGLVSLLRGQSLERATAEGAATAAGLKGSGKVIEWLKAAYAARKAAAALAQVGPSADAVERSEAMVAAGTSPAGARQAIPPAPPSPARVMNRPYVPPATSTPAVEAQVAPAQGPATPVVAPIPPGLAALAERQAVMRAQSMKLAEMLGQTETASRSATPLIQSGVTTAPNPAVGQMAREWIARYMAGTTEEKKALIRSLGGKLNFEDMRQLAAFTEDLR